MNVKEFENRNYDLIDKMDIATIELDNFINKAIRLARDGKVEEANNMMVGIGEEFDKFHKSIDALEEFYNSFGGFSD